jgi:large subunit ribosomal protein L21e
MSTYLIIFRVGDIVDIKANAAQQKGMPHKYYQGCEITSNLCAKI